MEQELRLSKGKVFEQLNVDTSGSGSKPKLSDKKGGNSDWTNPLLNKF